MLRLGLLLATLVALPAQAVIEEGQRRGRQARAAALASARARKRRGRRARPSGSGQAVMRSGAAGRRGVAVQPGLDVQQRPRGRSQRSMGGVLLPCRRRAGVRAGATHARSRRWRADLRARLHARSRAAQGGGQGATATRTGRPRRGADRGGARIVAAADRQPGQGHCAHLQGAPTTRAVGDPDRVELRHRGAVAQKCQRADAADPRDRARASACATPTTRRKTCAAAPPTCNGCLLITRATSRWRPRPTTPREGAVDRYRGVPAVCRDPRLCAQGGRSCSGACFHPFDATVTEPSPRFSAIKSLSR